MRRLRAGTVCPAAGGWFLEDRAALLLRLVRAVAAAGRRAGDAADQRALAGAAAAVRNGAADGPEPRPGERADEPGLGNLHRALKIAKPGAIGALVGAGLGAAGGAIANGGKAAGKGALIGGIAGAALGTGYGAYKTKNDCGTIFGNAFSGAPAAPSAPAAFASASPRTNSANQIQVYSVR